jgi:isopenicillin-N epimerase
MPSELASAFCLDPTILFLNHGSFGACPRVVLESQQRFRDRLELEPVRFFMRELEPLLDASRHALADFVGADEEGIAFVSNATAGVNAVLGSLDLGPDDTLLVTDHAYNACRNALDFHARRRGAEVAVAHLPFPLEDPERIVESVLSCVTPKTRVALLDHITSPTGILLPIERLVRELDARGVDTLVDGAHGPGMVALDLTKLGAAYYAGNLHKWVSAPKGAAFLYVREDKRAAIRPTVISHGANSPRKDRSRYLLEFDWQGTVDPTAVLAVPDAISTMAALVPGGFAAVMQRNRRLALSARTTLCEALGERPPAPDSMIGALAAVRLPDATTGTPALVDPLQDELFHRFRIEVPVVSWGFPKRWIRISAQLYNDENDYACLARCLREVLGTRRARRE